MFYLFQRAVVVTLEQIALNQRHCNDDALIVY